MGSRIGKSAGRSNLRVNRPPSFSRGKMAGELCHLRVHQVKWMRRLAHKALQRVDFAHGASTGAGLLFVLLCLLVLTACGLTSQQRVLYESAGIQVGIISDLSTDEHGSPPVRNRHPADLTPREFRSLLGSLEVSGWSGMVMGVFSTPLPRPVFTEAEMILLADPLVAAFHQATPHERVFFSIQNPNTPYETDRTSGSIFFRDDYLHVILTDHYAFLKADTGGDETRDPRDTKGMKLWVVGPAQASTVPHEKEPHWNAYESIHISLKPVEVLTAWRAPSAATDSSPRQVAVPAAGQPAVKADTMVPNATESVNDLRLQIRELTNANLDLRAQLKEQLDTMEKLKGELEQLRNAIKTGNSNPPSGRKPSAKRPTP